MPRSSVSLPEGIIDLGPDSPADDFIITDVVGLTEADQLSADRGKKMLNAGLDWPDSIDGSESDQEEPSKGPKSARHIHLHLKG